MNYKALFTLPERKHPVHTLILFTVPFIMALTLFRLGSQVLLL